MRKITFLKTCFLALILLMGIGNAWAETVTYTISAKNTLTTTGTAPSGSSAAIDETFGTTKQMTSGNSQTVTLSGYSGYKITSITLSMKSNTSSGSGNFIYKTDGGTDNTIVETNKFNSAAWNGKWSTDYVNVIKSVNIVCGTTSTVLKIAATENSLYCQSYSLTYESVGPPCTPSNLAFASSTATKIMGDAPFTITPTTLNETTAIAYSSSDIGVATVNSSTGEVTIVGAGTTKIKADQAAGTHNSTAYCVGSVEYTLTVAPLDAPVATAATAITPSGFTANWGAVDGVSGYELSVYKKDGSLVENFDTQSGTGGNSGGWNGTIASTTIVGLTDWALTSAYGADKCIRLGTKDNQGVATTPALGLNGNATLIFRAGAWNASSEQTELLLAIEGGGNLSQSSVTLTKGAFTSYSVNITGGTASTKVSFKGKQAKDSRFFLDDVKVSTLTPITGSPFTTPNNFYFLSELSPSSVYTYTVKSKVSSTLSAASNEVTAITAINGAIKANSLPACPDCNIAIADGGHLTVEAKTTYASITAEAGSKITVADGKSLTVTELVLENDLNKAATVIGNISSTSAEVRQQLGTARNWYLASAISGASITEIVPVAAGAPRKAPTAVALPYEYLKEYNETTGVWDDATDWVVGRGYILKPTNDYAQFAFTGTSLTSGVQTIALTRTATIGDNNNLFKGYNLVGNPYPSYLNINALIGHTANYYDIAHTIWYRTHDGSSWSFPTFNAKSGVGVPSDNLGLVPPMQAFWVQATQATNLTFENSMRLHNPSDSNVPFKAPRQQANSVLRLQIDNGAVKDETVLYLNELAANALDSFDSPKMMNNGTTVPNIFTLAGGEKLIINGMNELANGTEIPLGVQANAGTFTVRATEFSNFAEGDRVELLDKLTGTLTDITASDYALSSATNINTADRFALRFGRVATDKQNLSNDGLTVFTHHNRIHVAASELALGSAIRVYNQVGQLVASQPVSGALNVVNAQLHAGVYVVSVNNITVKVILK